MSFTDVTPQQTSVPAQSGNTGRMAKFIPELWSDEVIAEYEKNLVLAPLVRKLPMKGKKGDTVHIPIPDRNPANAKAAETAVTLNSDTAGEKLIVVNRHFEWSMMIEDIAEVQALSSARRFYTEDAGYALAIEVDTSLGYCAIGWGDSSVDFNAGDNPATAANWVHSHSLQPNDDTAAATAGTLEAYDSTQTNIAGNISDISVRGACRRLDDLNVPMTGRQWVISPSQAEAIRGIERYNSVDFVNNKGTVNGQIGNLYGNEIFVSTNVPNGADAGCGIAGSLRGNLYFHKDAIVLAEQMGVRTQTQYKQEHLSDLFTADRLYGASDYRPLNGLVIVTP